MPITCYDAVRPHRANNCKLVYKSRCAYVSCYFMLSHKRRQGYGGTLVVMLLKECKDRQNKEITRFKYGVRSMISMFYWPCYVVHTIGSFRCGITAIYLSRNVI